MSREISIKFNIERENIRFRIREACRPYVIKELAARIGINEATIRNYYTGRSNPNYFIVKMIAQATGCNEKWLLTGEGEPYPQMVAAGSIEEATLGAEVEEPEIDLDYWRDAGIFEKWVAEENAIVLYNLKQNEIDMLKKLPVLGFEDYEENYARLYRLCLVYHRQNRIEEIRRLKRARKLKPPGREAAEGGGR